MLTFNLRSIFENEFNLASIFFLPNLAFVVYHTTYDTDQQCRGGRPTPYKSQHTSEAGYSTKIIQAEVFIVLNFFDKLYNTERLSKKFVKRVMNILTI